MDGVHNQLRDFLCDVLRCLEENHEEERYYKCVGGEDIPCCAPVRLGCVVNEVVDDSLCAEGSDGCSDTVGHEHEETLGTVLELLACAHIGVKRS